MSVVQPKVLISERELSELSRKTLQPDVLEYQLRSLFMRPGFRPGDISLRVFYPGGDKKEEQTEIKYDGFRLLLEGPFYTEVDDESVYSPFIQQWIFLYRNYLQMGGFRKRFINGMSQLRFISFNPLTIYYQLLAEEQKKVITTIPPEPKTQMRRMIVKPPRIQRDGPGKKIIKEEPRTKKISADVRKGIKRDGPGKKIMKEEPRVERMPAINLQLPFYDGNLPTERYEDEAQRPGATSWAGGYVDDEIPADVRKIDPELDFPNGAIMNMFPEYPFYAFGYWNIFKKIEGLNRMIEAGLEIVFLPEVGGMSLGKVKDIYRGFFSNWGIPVIDYVGAERLMASGLTYMIPSDRVLPGFFVIRRPVERLHSSAWAGMNGVRRRGLPGIPWARNELSGNLLVDSQPDDGFLSQFVMGGLEKRIAGGGPEMELRFPLCTLHTPSEIRREIVDPLEKILRRDIRFRAGEGMTATAELRNIGEWMLLRGLLRKSL